MRQILIKSILAVTLGTVPGLVYAQSEMLKKKPPEQSEGQRGGQPGTEKGQGGESGRPMEENGGAGQRMEHEGQQRRSNPQSEENRNEQGGEQKQPGTGGENKQPSEKQGEENRGGTSEHHAERGHVSEEQRSELKRAFRENHVEPAHGLNFSVDIGARVPREVHLYRLPPRIVEIVPAYEGYMYFELADGRIAIVDPGTLEIVLIIA